MTTAKLTEKEFTSLKDGGFFTIVLIHPEIEVYRCTDGIFYVRLPGHGAIGISSEQGTPR